MFMIRAGPAHPGKRCFALNRFTSIMVAEHRANHAAGRLSSGASLHDSQIFDNVTFGREKRASESGASQRLEVASRHGAREEFRLIDPDKPEFPPSNIGRRSAPRLRLSLPGQLIAVERVHRCILLNLSRSGAQVAILDALRVGEGAILRCGGIDDFGIVTRSEFGLNALQFEEPLSNSQVLEIRHLFENFEERERRALMDTARKWVTGDTDDDRPG